MIDNKNDFITKANLTDGEVICMLDDGWNLLNVSIIPFTNYHGIINRDTIRKEFYFIKNVTDACENPYQHDMNFNNLFSHLDSSDPNNHIN